MCKNAKVHKHYTISLCTYVVPIMLMNKLVGFIKKLTKRYLDRLNTKQTSYCNVRTTYASYNEQILWVPSYSLLPNLTVL